MSFFEISADGNTWTDLSGYINIQEYAVNKTELFEEWQDADYDLHRVHVGDRVQGTFTLGFDSKSDLTTVVGYLSSYRDSDNQIWVKAYCHNTGAQETVLAYLDYVGAGSWDQTNSRQWLTLDVTVTGV